MQSTFNIYETLTYFLKVYVCLRLVIHIMSGGWGGGQSLHAGKHDFCHDLIMLAFSIELLLLFGVSERIPPSLPATLLRRCWRKQSWQQNRLR